MTTTTVAATITAEATAWLDANVAPLTKGNSKRLAFRVIINEMDLILLADSAGKSTPTYSLLHDEGADTLTINNKPVAVRTAPENISNFESLMSGGEVAFSSTEEGETPTVYSPEIEQTDVLPEEAPAEEGFNPTPKDSMLLGGDEAPTLIDMPSAKSAKVAKEKKEKKEKIAKVSRSHREKLIDKICRDMGVTVPDPMDLYADVLSNGVKLIPFKELCACNHPAFLMSNPKGEVGKAISEVLHHHANSNLRNLLNLSSEVDPARVLVLMQMILRTGRLIRAIDTCTINDTIPHSSTLDIKGKVPEAFDPTAIQVYAGRNRSLALALIYGEDVLIPCTTRELTYEKAMQNCVLDNLTRNIGKSEQIHVDATMRKLAVGDDVSKQFSMLGGKAKAIASFIANATVIDPEDTTFYRPKFIQVGDKRTAINVTTAFYKSSLECALVASGMGVATKLDDKVKNGISMIVEAMDLLAEKLVQQFALDAERKLVWTFYSAGAFGYLIGDALVGYMKGFTKGNGPEYAADLVCKLVVRAFTTTDDAAKVFAQTPPKQLMGVLQNFDTDNAAPEGAEGEDIDTGLLG